MSTFHGVIRELPKTPDRILIVRLGALGDVARVLPMLNGLRIAFPKAEIDWIVQSKAADLLRGHAQIDQLHVVPFRRWSELLSPAPWRLASVLRGRRYDLVLDFQGMAKGAVWAVAAGGRAVRVGWGPGHVRNFSWLAYHGLRYPSGKQVNRHLRHRAIVDWLGVPDVPGTYTFEDGDKTIVDRFLATLADRPRPWILAYPGSSVVGAHKRWAPGQLIAALREVRRATGGTILVGWGPAEEDDARRVSENLADAVTIPPTTIGELAYLLSRCDLFIGMDTGPMHISALVGTPVVAVFGRSSAEVHGPADHLPGRAVAGVDARHWPRRKRAGLEPFTDPPPEAVVDVALELLRRYGTGGEAAR